MTREEAISLLIQVNKILVNNNAWRENTHEPLNEAFDMAIEALGKETYEELDFVQEHKKIPVNIQITEQEPCEDVERKIEKEYLFESLCEDLKKLQTENEKLRNALEQEPKTDKYEYHIDHTDCIWYGSDSGCPVTCSQYRDGWNDAMKYIYLNGKGYQPYRRE